MSPHPQPDRLPLLGDHVPQSGLKTWGIHLVAELGTHWAGVRANVPETESSLAKPRFEVRQISDFVIRYSELVSGLVVRGPSSFLTGPHASSRVTSRVASQKKPILCGSSRVHGSTAG